MLRQGLQCAERAVKAGLISEKEVDVAVGRVLAARFRLGMFDPPEKVPFAQIPISENDTPAHAALALKGPRESIVLLKNNGVLPLDRAKIKRLAVIGANADSVPDAARQLQRHAFAARDPSRRHQSGGRPERRSGLRTGLPAGVAGRRQRKTGRVKLDESRPSWLGPRTQ